MINSILLPRGAKSIHLGNDVCRYGKNHISSMLSSTFQALGKSGFIDEGSRKMAPFLFDVLIDFGDGNGLVRTTTPDKPNGKNQNTISSGSF